MVNFSNILSKHAGEAKKPQALPIGDYPGIIKSYELGDNNKNKTPYVRFLLGLMGWPDGIDESDTMQEVAEGKFEKIDLSKRQFRRDFYLTEDALWRLDEFIASCGPQFSGLQYDVIFPQLVGQQVLVEVQQYIPRNSEDGLPGNQVGKLIGQS